MSYRCKEKENKQKLTSNFSEKLVTFLKLKCLINAGRKQMKSETIETLFTKFYNDALLYSLSLTKNYAVAEEIVSDAFFKALKTADDEIENFKAWLLKVCRNSYLNILRKSKRLEKLDENIKDESDTALDRIIKDEDYRALLRAISLLKSSQQEVITLFYYQNLSIKDIALITNKKENVVKVTLYRARESLKEILTKIN